MQVFIKEGTREELVEHVAYFQPVEKFYFFHFPLPHLLFLYFYRQEDSEGLLPLYLPFLVDYNRS